MCAGLVSAGSTPQAADCLVVDDEELVQVASMACFVLGFRVFSVPGAYNGEIPG